VGADPGVMTGRRLPAARPCSHEAIASSPSTRERGMRLALFDVSLLQSAVGLGALSPFGTIGVEVDAPARVACGSTDCDTEGLERILAGVSNRHECARREGERQSSGLP
jgi:hypothetical protein